eukprot:3475117-Ditylum_brightwellii.AAC.1
MEKVKHYDENGNKCEGDKKKRNSNKDYTKNKYSKDEDSKQATKEDEIDEEMNEGNVACDDKK